VLQALALDLADLILGHFEPPGGLSPGRYDARTTVLRFHERAEDRPAAFDGDGS